MLFDIEAPIRSFSSSFPPLRRSRVFLYILYPLCVLNLLQVLYNPHLQAPLGSAGNKGLITPLESALTRNSPVTSLESALTKTPGVPPSRDDFSSWHHGPPVAGAVGGRLCSAARPQTPTTPLWPRPCYHSPAAPNPRLLLPDGRSP